MSTHLSVIPIKTPRRKISPRGCDMCGVLNFNTFRYNSTGIVFYRCTKCSKYTISSKSKEFLKEQTRQ